MGCRDPRHGGRALDANAYAELVKPSEAVAPFTYGAVTPGLFDSIVEPRIRRPAPSHAARSTGIAWRIER